MRSRYSNAGEIFIMSIVWAIVLGVLTSVLTPAEEQATTSQMETPQVRMLLRHVGCNEQHTTAVVQALTTLPWLSTVEFKSADQKPGAGGEAPTHGEEAKREEPCIAHVTAQVQDVQQADFMQVLQVLRDIGVAPKTFEFGGLPRFALVATVSDLSCQSCPRAAFQALTPLKVSVTYYSTTNSGNIDPARITSFTWLESKSLNKSDHAIIANVRSNRIAQVDEMIRALQGAGLYPLSVRIMTKADKA